MKSGMDMVMLEDDIILQSNCVKEVASGTLTW